jgi:pyrophosphatase PpaX
MLPAPCCRYRISVVDDGLSAPSPRARLGAQLLAGARRRVSLAAMTPAEPRGRGETGRVAPRPLALLFDLDGTLVDSVGLILASFRHACATTLGRVPADEEWIPGIGTPLPAQFRPFAESDEQLDALVRAYRAFQREHHDRLTREFVGTRETMALLHERGHPTALVTSKIVELAERALRFTGLRDFIDVVVGADSTTRHKPHPEPVHVALERLGRAASQAVFVGDSPHDIAAGNSAGVVTVAALWGPFGRDALERAGPDYIIGSITELPALVERIASGLGTGDSGLDSSSGGVGPPGSAIPSPESPVPSPESSSNLPRRPGI